MTARIARAWRGWTGRSGAGLVAEAAAGAVRVALVGNCQAAAIGRALRLLRPDAAITYLSAGTLGRRRRAPEEFARDLAPFDVVLGQRINAGSIGPAHWDALAGTGRFHPVPAFVFAAFHPDLVYVGGPGTPVPEFVDSPVGHYHSALVLYGHLAGFTVDETVRLFRREVFAGLGYLDLWEYSRATLVGLGRECGLDLGPSLLKWLRRGAFMHSVNHPRMFVLADVARLVAARAGLDVTDFDLDGFLVDDLALKGAWPLYEPVARHYGFEGGAYVFPAQAIGRRRTEAGRIYHLRPFVEASFAAYAAAGRDRLRCDRVDAWLANDDLGRTFRDWAG